MSEVEERAVLEAYVAGFTVSFQTDAADPNWAVVTFRVPRYEAMRDAKFTGAEAASELMSFCRMMTQASEPSP
jgi:hypothetical protein